MPTLEQIKTEAAPGAVIKAEHIDGIIESVSANSSYFNLAISCTAVDAPTIVNQKDANYGGTMTVTSISAGMYHIEHSGNLFSANSFFQLTSKTPNVIFAIGSLIGVSAVEIVIRDTNGFVTSLSANEGFTFKVER